MTARIPLIGAVLAVLLGLGYFLLLHQPQSQEQALLEEETGVLTARQAALAADVERLQAVRDDQPRIAAEMARLEALIPSTIAQPSAIRQFQAVADAAGVEIRSVSFGEPTPADPAVTVGTDQQLGRISTTMVMDGGYFSAVDFLRRVEQDNDRAVLVQTLAMEQGEAGFPALSTTWTGNLFALLPLNTPPPAAAPAAPGGFPDGAQPPLPDATTEPGADGSAPLPPATPAGSEPAEVDL